MISRDSECQNFSHIIIQTLILQNKLQILLVILNINTITIKNYLTRVKPIDISHDVPNPQIMSTMLEYTVMH